MSFLMVSALSAFIVYLNSLSFLLIVIAMDGIVENVATSLWIFSLNMFRRLLALYRESYVAMNLPAMSRRDIYE